MTMATTAWMAKRNKGINGIKGKRPRRAALRKRELIGDRVIQVDMKGKNARDNMQKLIDERIRGMQEL